MSSYVPPARSFSSMGFSGEDIDELEPRYLIIADHDGLKSIRSFDLATFIHPDKLVSASPRFRGNMGSFYKHPEWRASLPPEIVDLRRVRAQLVKDVVLNEGILDSGKLSGIPIFAQLMIISQIFTRGLHQKRALQAIELRVWLEEAMEEGSLEVLYDHFSSAEIAELSQALYLKFGDGYGSGISRTFAISSRKQAAIYEKKRTAEEKARSENDAKLRLEFERLGFKSLELAQRFFLVYCDKRELNCNEVIENIDGKLSELGQDAVSQKFREMILQSDDVRIPVGIVWRELPKKEHFGVLNFQAPMKIAGRHRRVKFFELLSDLGLSFSPSFLITVPIKFVDGSFRSILSTGVKSTAFDEISVPLSRFKALLELGLIRLEDQELVLAVFSQNLLESGASPTEVEKICAGLESENAHLAAEAAREALLHYTKASLRKVDLLDSPRRVESFWAKRVNVERLARYLSKVH